MTLRLVLGKEVLRDIIFDKQLIKFVGKQEQIYQLLIRFFSFKKKTMKNRYKDLIYISSFKKKESPPDSIMTKYEWYLIDISLTNKKYEDEVFQDLIDCLSKLTSIKKFPKDKYNFVFNSYNYFSKSRLVKEDQIEECTSNHHGFNKRPINYSILKEYNLFLGILRN